MNRDKVEISSVLMVTLGGIKGYWIPTEQIIDGHQFLISTYLQVGYRTGQASAWW